MKRAYLFSKGRPRAMIPNNITAGLNKYKHVHINGKYIGESISKLQIYVGFYMFERGT
jgi:hypothetical protein